MNIARSLMMFLLLGLTLPISACSDPACFELEYNSVTKTCDCPARTTPNFELQVCEGPAGNISWTGIDPTLLPVMELDGGVTDGGMDVAPPITLRDMGLDNENAVDSGPDQSIEDSGMAPAPTAARFPWNGFTTGSVHVPLDTRLTNHPLRPKFGWEPVSEAHHYNVQLTRDCDLERFRECEFATLDIDQHTAQTVFRPESALEVALARPVGSRYFWRVRACSEANSCSNWTEVRYVDVGRLPDDFNGDGYPDLIVGATFHNETGGAFIYFGGAGGPASVPALTLLNPDEFADDGRFGKSVASLGDVNGDGYGDSRPHGS